MDQTTRFCTNCGCARLHARPGTNHLLHFLITFFLCGFWLPVWILSSIRIGGWRCQTCGSRGAVIPLLVLPLVMILSITAFAFAAGYYWLHAGGKVDSTSQAPAVPAQGPLAERPADVLIPPVVEAPTTDPVIMASLQGIQLPATIITIEPVSLLNEVGNETIIPAKTTITILERAKLGSLNMVVKGKTFVGNESRLIGKARFIGK